MIGKILARMGYEKRTSSSYTETLVSLLTGNASGRRVVASATGALEACAGLVGRAFASAEVMAPDYAKEALTPERLALVGRTLIRKGEILFMIDVMDGRLKLFPASSYDIYGDRDPDGWRYRIDMAGPDIRTTQAELSAQGVLHFTYCTEPERPWRGLGPVQVALLAGELSAETAAALRDEASGPRGSFLPTPKDGADPTLTQLKQDIKNAPGRMHVVESMASAWQSGTAPPADWMQKRFGADPPEGLLRLQTNASREVMAACGFSSSLFLADTESGAREAWRQALFGVISPLGKLVEHELRRKLDAPDLTLGWSELRASDLQARARSFKSMVDGGMEIEKAAALSGLLLPEDE